MKRQRNIPRCVLSVAMICASLTVTACSSSSSQSSEKSGKPTAQAAGRAFETPQQAADALVAAVRNHDSAQLDQIFGPSGREIISSGDEVIDRQNANKFLAAYDEAHALVPAAEGGGDVMTLQVGKSDWPMPVPIVKGPGGWFFDVEAGREEILDRRIGDNELSAEQVCLAVVDAQRDYAMSDPDHDGLRDYAPKFFSDAGLKNGLYWQTAPGEPASPLGELVADAAAEGYTTARTASGTPRPYHGYHYRILTAQGPAAPGGARDYVVNGKLLGGFGVVAYPAQYGNTGIMTFITNHDGVLYQKDLGPETAKIAAGMTAFDPGEGWKKVE